MRNSIHNIQNEEYYKLVANNINDLVALYSPAGVLEYVSPSVSRLLGYAVEGLTGLDPMTFVHPDDRHLIVFDEEILQEKKDTCIAFEYRLKHNNGHWVYFESYRQPIFDAAGKLTNVLAVCRDISARKKAEQALRESEQLYHRLADNILDLVVIFNPEGVRLYVSPSSYSLLGYTPEELTGRNFTDIVHPDDAASIRAEILHKAWAGEDKFLIDLLTRHKQGHWVYCETTIKAIRDNEGKVNAFLSTTRDITQWKLAQAALKESEEKYRSLVESSDAMIAIVNSDGEFVFVNDKRAAFLGQPKENIIGKTAYDFYDKPTAERFMHNVQRVFDEKKKHVFEEEIVYQQRAYWLRVTMHPVFDSVGSVYSVMVNTIDITGIKNSEDALRKQNDELKQIAFLQSHIVRSPLTNIEGILYLINEEELTGENRYYFQLLKQATEKLDEIIKDIVERAILVKRQTMEVL